MSDIVIVDTSVLLNGLDIPGRNQDREDVFEEFGALVDGGASLLLPMAGVFETGNHIARLRNPEKRRHHAKCFCDQVRKALKDEAPWTLVPLPELADLAQWLDKFPNHVNERYTKGGRAKGGPDMSDLSIIEACEAARARHSRRRVVRIWSLDGDLQGYGHRR